MATYEERYQDEFGEKVPNMYFSTDADARDATEKKIERGESFSEREWLKEAGYLEEQIDETLEGERLI